MARWKILYCPESGQRDSPHDYILGLSPPDEAHIKQKLDTLTDLNPSEWPSKWVKRVQEFYQLKSGDHRLLFFLDEAFFVVCHACRKRSQKTKPEDLNRARMNRERYYSEKGNNQ